MSCAADESDNETFAEIVGTTSAHAEGDVLMTNLALFYLRMQAKMLLPATTISALRFLIDEFQDLHEHGMTHVLAKVSQELTKLEIPRDRIQTIVEGLSKENLLKMYNQGVFRSDQTRKTFF